MDRDYHRRAASQSRLIRLVQVDGLVILKMIKHHQSEGQLGEYIQGVLLGLIMDDRLEITHCFPFPSSQETLSDFNEDEYQMDMLHKLRNLNVDHEVIGWYRSASHGGYFNGSLIDSQFTYQESIPESVVVIYDPIQTAQGHLTIKAFRLSQAAMKCRREEDFTFEALKSHRLTYSNAFEEVPVVYRNSNLTNVLLCQMKLEGKKQKHNKHMDLTPNTVLEDQLKLIMSSVQELSASSNVIGQYYRAVAKQQQAKLNFQQKRREENELRKQRGEPSLPEEDVEKHFKPIMPPSRLEHLLVSSQIDQYCQTMSKFASQRLEKLFISESLQSTSTSQ